MEHLGTFGFGNLDRHESRVGDVDADCAKALFTERLTDQSREISNSLEYANVRAPINFHSSTPFNMNELNNPSFW